MCCFLTWVIPPLRLFAQRWLTLKGIASKDQEGTLYSTIPVLQLRWHDLEKHIKNHCFFFESFLVQAFYTHFPELQETSVLFGTWHICHAWLCAILCAVAASNMGNCSCWSTLRLAQTTRPWATTQARLAVGDVYPREEKKTRLREIQNTQKHCNLKTKLQKKNIHAGKLTCPVKRDYFNRKYSFQPLIFRGHVSFSGVYIRNMLPTLGKGKTFCQPNCTSSLI